MFTSSATEAKTPPDVPVTAFSLQCRIVSVM